LGDTEQLRFEYRGASRWVGMIAIEARNVPTSRQLDEGRIGSATFGCMALVRKW
jgi:hypothetical protein